MTDLKTVTPSGVTLEVVPIGRAKPDPGVVDALERFLRLAKSGEVRGLVMIASLRDGSHDHSISGSSEAIPTLGRLARLSHRIQADLDSGIVHYEPEQGG